MAVREVGSWVWLPDSTDLVVPAKVTRVDASTVDLETEDGGVRSMAAAQALELAAADAQCLDARVDDLILLHDLNENAILHNLRLRFKEKAIYTNVGSILVSVNPFQLLPLYTADVMDTYRDGSRGQPPHVFGVAVDAYGAMVSGRRDQSVVISGESGAGKSEATKLILQCVADVASRRGGGGASDALEQRILQSNPILEALGNAKTVRNDNSSRFGKLISIKFDGSGAIVGGTIFDFLLEKSRVSHQSAGERNYHVFYELMAGCAASTPLKEQLALNDAPDYRYLDQSGVSHIPGHSDEEAFEILQRSMETLDYTGEETLDVYKTLAAILHLSNLRFDAEAKATEEDAARLCNPTVLETASQLLGISPFSLGKALTSRNVGQRSVIQVSYGVCEAVHTRDAACKAVYGALFKWTLAKINSALASKKDCLNVLSVLDIFGFESFESNSFEQLCINYANEKLQGHFNDHIFKLEQKVYAFEGVQVPISNFRDNSNTLDLLERKTSGIFAMLDEEISVPKGSDEGFLSKVLKAHGSNDSFVKAFAKNCVKDAQRVSFGVLHYAGPVLYDTSGFLEKNKDRLHDDVARAIMGSSSEFVRGLAPPEVVESSAGRRLRAPAAPKKKVAATLGSQFKTQLADLMDTLTATEPHFVRCMKPNKLKAGGLFDSSMMLSQMRYSGLLEVCRIRKLGHPVRRPFDDFVKRYRCLSQACGIEALLWALVAKGVLVEGQFAKGTSKVFLRGAQAQALECAREDALVEVAMRLQTFGRGFVHRLRYAVMKRIVDALKAAVLKRDEAAILSALDMRGELPFYGEFLPAVVSGQRLLVRLQGEARCLSLLQAAVAKRDRALLKSAVSAASTMAFSLCAVAAAEALLAEIEREDELKALLKAAIVSRDGAALDSLLLRAAHLDGDEVRQARAVQARLCEEEKAMHFLRGAMDDRSIARLVECLAKCSELGLDDPDLAAARKLHDDLALDLSVKSQLAGAVDRRSLDDVRVALAKASALGVGTAEVAYALALQATLEAEAACLLELVTAADKRDVSALTKALSSAAALGMPSLGAYSAKIDEVRALKAALEAELECEGLLLAATQSQNVAALTSVLAKSSALGLTGAIIAAAREALAVKSQASVGLVAAASFDSVADVEKAIATAQTGDEATPEMAAARARIAWLQDEAELLRQLETASRGADASALAKLVADAGLKGGFFSAKHASALATAKAALERLQAAGKLLRAEAAASVTRELPQLEAAISTAESKGCDVSSARETLALLRGDAAVLAALSAALVCKDVLALRAAYAAAVERNLETDDFARRAQLVFDRDAVVSAAHAALEACLGGEKRCGAAMRPVEFGKELNQALSQALHLGLVSATVDASTKLRDDVAVYCKSLDFLNAACRTATVQAQSPGGLEDVAQMHAALRAAAEAGVDASAFAQQAALAAKLEEQLKVQLLLTEALASEDRRFVKSALEAAEDLELDLAVMEAVKVRLKGLESAHRSRQLTEELAPVDADGDASRLLRLARLERAGSDKYALEHYAGLRSTDAFAKGVILHKKRTKDGMLKFSREALPRSLLDLDAAGSKQAVQVFRSLLGYMGDKSMAFPATLAQDVLRKGLDSHSLRDEVYAQLMKQLSSNATADSTNKGWQLLCMTVSTFPPSMDFELYALHFLLQQREKRGAVRNYASYCLRALEGMLEAGASGFLPSINEILAYKERPPILATISLVDGSVFTDELPVTPDLCVAKVCDICAQFLELSDPRQSSFGIFVYDGPAESDDPAAGRAYCGLERTPRPLTGNEFLGDVIVLKARQKRAFKFVYKRKVFLPNQAGASEDEVFSRLNYLQAENDTLVLGNLTLYSLDEAIKLAAISLAVAFADGLPDTVAGLAAMVNPSLQDFLPPNFRGVLNADALAAELLPFRDSLGLSALSGGDAAAILKLTNGLQQKFVDAVSGHDLYGAYFFHVRKDPNANDAPLALALPDDLTLAFHARGMTLFEAAAGNNPRSKLRDFGYADVYRWGGASGTFSLHIYEAALGGTFELKVATAQAADMAAILLDYISAIMAAQ